MQRMLNGMVRAHALIAADPLVHHSTCHSARPSKTLESENTLSTYSLGARAVAFRLSVSSLSLTHSVSGALSAGN